MRLCLFRSLVASQRRPRLSALASAQYDGIEISLSQLEHAPATLNECAEHSLRVICRAEPIDANDAQVQLDRLSSRLSSVSADAAAAVELVVMTAPKLDSDELLSHLRHIQPLWSQFLEAHQTVGSRHGKKNAHGNELGHHVLGVCHRLRSLGAADLAETVDILSPTRLALTSTNLAASIHSKLALGAASATAPPPMNFAGLGEDLEATVEATDLLYADADDVRESSLVWALWDEVWAAQQLAGADEVYAVCGDGEVVDEAALHIATSLRTRFDDSTQWRAGAGERRAAQESAARAQRYFAPTSVLGSAAAAFGIGPAELDGLDKVRLKERWRQLALKAHPDLVGGSGVRFQQLRAAYKVLLRAA